MTADQTASFIVIRVCDLDPVRSRTGDRARAVQAGCRPLAARWRKNRARFAIVGHTDNTPIKNVRFPSNFELSLERAKAVAAVLKQGLSDPGRVEIDGKGADAPIADNSTPEGRANNRRVEIFIARSE